MPGPQKKPTTLKVLEGNPGKRALPANEPQPQKDAKVPACPAYLKGVARREWERVAGELYRLGLLTVVDHAALEAYCSAYQDAVEATQELARLKRNYREYLKSRKKDPRQVRPSNGMICFTSKNNVIIEPMVSVEKQAWERVKSFAVEFGMTPASRARIGSSTGGAGKKKAQSPLERMLDGEAAKREIIN